MQITVWSEGEGGTVKWFYSIHVNGKQEFTSAPYWWTTKEYAWDNAVARINSKD